MKKRQFPRNRPDPLLEEVMAALSKHVPYDLMSLFEVVHEKLRARNAAHSGQEMLRLRTYEKLQALMIEGAITKTGKTYQAVPGRFEAIQEEMAKQQAKVQAAAKSAAATAASAASAASRKAA